ncbi:MAG: RNA polymerase sigma factor [Bacillota bacterium]
MEPVVIDNEKAVPFEVLYDTYFDRINRYLRYRAPSVWDADDLTATVFTRALEKYHLFRGDAPVVVWLFRIAHNALVDHLRTGKRYVLADSGEIPGGAGCGEPEEHILKLEELGRLRDVLDSLMPVQRDVITLRYVGELKFSQIARVLGKTDASVRMIHHRALKAVRKGLHGKE